MYCPVIALTQQLIKRQSTNQNSDTCQQLLIERLRAIGFQIELMNIDKTNNFWAFRPGSVAGPTLAFAGHTDGTSVGIESQWKIPPFKPKIDNGVLYGCGATHMKGSLASMLVAAERFVTESPNYSGQLAFLISSSDKAGATNGTVKIVEKLKARSETINYCLIGRPSSNKYLGDVICNGRFGSITANLTIHGGGKQLAHSHSTQNPTHNAIPMLNELIKMVWDRGNKFFPATSMQIVNIQTNISKDYVVPNDIFLQFNFCFNTEVTDGMIRTKTEALLNKHRLHYTLDWALSAHPFLTSQGKLIDSVINSVKHYTDITPQLCTSDSVSDGRFIAYMGAQVIELGPINTPLHQINESVKAADLQLLSRIYQRIMEQLLP